MSRLSNRITKAMRDPRLEPILSHLRSAHRYMIDAGLDHLAEGVSLMISDVADRALERVEQEGKPFRITLESRGNPDFGQFAPVSETKIVRAATLAEIAKVAQEYIRFWNLGGGNWVMPYVYKDGKRFGFIAYNGRVFKGKNTEPQKAVEIDVQTEQVRS